MSSIAEQKWILPIVVGELGREFVVILVGVVFLMIVGLSRMSWPEDSE